VVDLGTGDGRSVLHLARRDPHALVIGIDAVAASMRDASRRAARPAAKGGWSNVVFVVAAVESLPTELTSVADEVRVTFPWGSLLRGVLGADEAALEGVARVAKRGAQIRALISVTERDGLGVDPDAGCALLSSIYRASGLRLVEARPATREEIAGANSSWAKRLRAGVDRPVTMLRAVRDERRR
jgi:16S rRNA (adenine(1408)-N(1))-methyltransferase